MVRIIDNREHLTPYTFCFLFSTTALRFSSSTVHILSSFGKQEKVRKLQTSIPFPNAGSPSEGFQEEEMLLDSGSILHSALLMKLQENADMQNTGFEDRGLSQVPTIEKWPMPTTIETRDGHPNYQLCRWSIQSSYHTVQIPQILVRKRMSTAYSTPQLSGMYVAEDFSSLVKSKFPTGPVKLEVSRSSRSIQQQIRSSSRSIQQQVRSQVVINMLDLSTERIIILYILLGVIKWR